MQGGGGGGDGAANPFAAMMGAGGMGGLGGMGGMGGMGMPGGGANNAAQPPEERFRVQLEKVCAGGAVKRRRWSYWSHVSLFPSRFSV